jgi:hypothetical protein
VKRCTAADGTLVYTDRKCDDIGATERVGAMPSAGGAIAGRYRNVCARTVQDLVYSFSNALQSGDANQVAGVYDWAGMPTSTAYNVMTRLEAIAKRPLIDVQPMYSGDTNAYGDDIVTFDETTGEVVTRAPRKPAPDRLARRTDAGQRHHALTHQLRPAPAPGLLVGAALIAVDAPLSAA